MTQTLTPSNVTTVAVVGGRGSVAGWFAERNLTADQLGVATADTGERATRYVALDNLDTGDKDRFDHIVYV